MALALEKPFEGREPRRGPSLQRTRRASRLQRVGALIGHAVLLAITSSSAIVVLFIFYFIIQDALPFFRVQGIRDFVTRTAWYPSHDPASFGAAAIFVGSGLVTLGAIAVAVPLGVAAAICLSDVLSFRVRQIVKPVIEILAAIPSVAYGFFALVVFAPLLQERGGHLLAVSAWLVGIPVAGLATIVASDLAAARFDGRASQAVRLGVAGVLAALAVAGLAARSRRLGGIEISSGTNALNVAIILGVMAMPTVVSVSEDALQAAGRELREGAYALGATRAEAITRVILPAAASGIAAAVILGIMRAVGETMVVWMASGNAAQIPTPWYDLLEPVRTLTATIAGDMGEADQMTGSMRYHVLFAMALCLLTISFLCNVASEWIIARARRKSG